MGSGDIGASGGRRTIATIGVSGRRRMPKGSRVTPKTKYAKWQQEKFPEMFDPANYISGKRRIITIATKRILTSRNRWDTTRTDFPLSGRA